MKWLFSLRVSATDTHLVIEVDTNAVKKKLDSINQPSVYVPPPKPPLWDYYDNNQPKNRTTVKDLEEYLHQRRSQKNFATDIEELYSCCPDCDEGRNYTKEDLDEIQNDIRTYADNTIRHLRG